MPQTNMLSRAAADARAANPAADGMPAPIRFGPFALSIQDKRVARLV